MAGVCTRISVRRKNTRQRLECRQRSHFSSAALKETRCASQPPNHYGNTFSVSLTHSRFLHNNTSVSLLPSRRESSSRDAAGLRAQLDFAESKETFKHLVSPRRLNIGKKETHLCQTAACRRFLRWDVRNVLRGADRLPANRFVEEAPASCGITPPSRLTGENCDAEITRRVSGGVCVRPFQQGDGCTFTPTPRQKHRTGLRLLTLTGIIRVKKERFSSAQKYFYACLVNLKCRINKTDALVVFEQQIKTTLVQLDVQTHLLNY